MRSLAMWESDNYYDYWSQAKVYGDTKDLTKMVRLNGTWEEDSGSLKLVNLNEDGMLYITERASSSGSIRARFKRPSGDKSADFGIIINYKQETVADAAKRLGKDTATTEECKKTGIVIIQSETGKKFVMPVMTITEALTVYYYDSTAEEQLSYRTAVDLSISRDTWYWFMADYVNGHLDFYYATDGLAWSNILSMNITESYNADYIADADSGRFGLYMRNLTGYGNNYPFLSDTTVIPLDDNSQFPTSDTVLVDSEQIAYTSKSENGSTPDLSFQFGRSVASFTTTTGTRQTLGYTKDRNAYRIKPSLTGDILVKSVKIFMEKVGNPKDGLEVSIVSIDGSLLGTKKASALIPQSFVPDSGWVEFSFSNPVVDVAGRRDTDCQDALFVGLDQHNRLLQLPDHRRIYLQQRPLQRQHR